jgi:hypothetical protein
MTQWGTEGASYLLGGDSEAALKALDESYGAPAPNRRQPNIFRYMGAEKIEAYWGSPSDVQAYSKSEFIVGVRAKLWALSLLLVCHGDQPSKLSELCRRIAKQARKRNANNIEWIEEHAVDPRQERKRSEKKKDIEQLLRELISQRQKEACPAVTVASKLLDVVIDHGVTHFFSPIGNATTESENFKSLALKNYRTPSDIYLALRAALPARKLKEVFPSARRQGAPRDEDHLRQRLDRLSQLDPAIDRVRLPNGNTRRYDLPRRQDTIDPVVQQLFAAITYAGPGNARWLVVSGPPYCGKKAKIDGLLRLIASSDDKLVAPVSNAMSERTHLPVRGWSSKGIHYKQLLINVLNFLIEYCSQFQDSFSRQLSFSYLAAATLDELFELIAHLHVNCPTLFIFTDVDAFRADLERNVIRDIGIRRLIRTLLRSNERSRMLITTTEDLKGDERHYAIGMPDFRQFDVSPPHLMEFGTFIREELRDAGQALFDLDANGPVRGDDLICITTLINLSNGLSDEYTKSCKAFLEKPPSASEEERIAVYRHLITRIREEHLLYAIALIASSEDGLLDRSLHRLLTDWSAQDSEAAPPELFEMVSTLEGFAARAERRFLLRSRMVRYDIEEFGFEESHDENDRIWELDPLVSSMFLHAIALIEPQIGRVANRLIAAAARERAQIKKVMMRSPLGTRVTEDASRDIQSYITLLASIELPDKAFEPVNELPLRLCEREVFSIDPEVFQARRSLRFAVLCLLREDIDHDHRLTMVFDEDGLRLDLYLTLFQELGRRHQTLLGPLPLPARLPRHLSPAYFSDDQIISFMSTVALSAYHAQRFDVVHWVANLCESYVLERAIVDYPAKMVRIWCSQVDAYILKGGISEHGSHAETLEFVIKLRDEYFGNLETRRHRLEQNDYSHETEDVAWARADMRLLARQAELHGLMGNKDEAMRLYAELEHREIQLSERFTDHEPLVMSGRVARRYIRFVLQVSVTATEGLDQIEKAKTLLSVNASRLRRFSGADRIGVMLDFARLATARGQLAAALRWAEAANVRAQSGSVSHGGRLEALAVFADLNLRNAEGADALAVKALLKDAGNAVEDLETAAEILRYRPFMGIAKHLRSRHLLAEYMARKEAGLSDRQDRTLLYQAKEAATVADQILNGCIDASFATERAVTRRKIQAVRSLRYVEPATSEALD